MYNEAALERLAPGDGETRVPKAHEYEIAREREPNMPYLTPSYLARLLLASALAMI
jgi:hypothetical protein